MTTNEDAIRRLAATLTVNAAELIEKSGAMHYVLSNNLEMSDFVLIDTERAAAAILAAIREYRLKRDELCSRTIRSNSFR